MPSLLNPYVLLGALLSGLAIFAAGAYTGQDLAHTRAEAERAALVDSYNQRLRAEFARGNELSAALAAAEGRIVIKTVEVIKHVPSVTSGRPCLSPAAVGLLQPGSEAVHPDAPPGAPAAEDAADAATDTDVAFWIAGANGQYETCAARLNALIDYEAGQ